MFSVCIRNRISLHHLYRSHKPIPRSSILGSAFLLNALYSGHRFPIRNPRRCCHVYSRHETSTQHKKRNFNRSNLSDLLSIIFGIRPRGRQLHICAFRQFQWKLPTADNRSVWVHRSRICIWSEEVSLCKTKFLLLSNKGTN